MIKNGIEEKLYKRFDSAEFQLWLEERSLVVTSTKIAELFGLNFIPFNKEESETEDQFKDKYLIAGRILEPAVKQAFLEHLDIKVEDILNNENSEWSLFSMYQDNENKIAASPDGFAKLKDGRLVLVECKSMQQWEQPTYLKREKSEITLESYKYIANSGVNRTIKSKYLSWKDELPINYYLQVQIQLMLLGQFTNHEIQSCLIGGLQYSYGLPFIVYEVKPSQYVSKLIIKTVAKYLEDKENFKVSKADRDNLKEYLKNNKPKLIYQYNPGLNEKVTNA